MIGTTITIPHKSKVFVLEDDKNRLDWFHMKLGTKHLYYAWSPDPKYVIGRIDLSDMDLMFLDHDLGDDFRDGTYFAQQISGMDLSGTEIIIHSSNPVGAKRMKKYLPGALTIPFGRFKIRVENE